MKTRVVNRYHGEPFDVSIMRPGPFGNPFRLGVDGNRSEVLEKYRSWFYSSAQSEFRKRVRRELTGKVLGCCCKPKACHGDVICEFLNRGKRLVAPKQHEFYCGNVLTVLRSLPAASVQVIVTSPPYYGLRSYGTEPQIWGGNDECKHVWSGPLPGKRQRWGNLDILSAKQRSNRGSRDNVAVIERDGGRFCQSCNAWLGELGQEPSLEMYIRHLRLVFEEAYRVLKEDGLLFLNLGDCYAPDKNLYGMPWRTAICLQDRGRFILRNAIVWYKPNAMPTSVKDRFTPSYEMVFMLAKSSDYYFDVEAVKLPAKASSIERNKYNAGCKKGGVYPSREAGRGALLCPDGMVRRRDVWTIATANYRGEHTAVFPEELVQPCILAGSRIGDTVLDPFGGSGTVSTVAKRLGRRSIYIDLLPANVDEARRRVHV